MNEESAEEIHNMKSASSLRLLTGLVFSAVFALSALAAPDFTGTWVMNVSKSKNLGMMSAMQITLKIEQTENTLKVTESTKFNGQDQVRELHYDLSGKSTANNGPMGDANQTVTKWVANTLETTWTQDGAVAGTKNVSQETRWLSDSGKTMNDQYARGTKEPMVIVFDKQ
jgi:hypothetical protein